MRSPAARLMLELHAMADLLLAFVLPVFFVSLETCRATFVDAIMTACAQHPALAQCSPLMSLS
jgi:hypothetical protein